MALNPIGAFVYWNYGKFVCCVLIAARWMQLATFFLTFFPREFEPISFNILSILYTVLGKILLLQAKKWLHIIFQRRSTYMKFLPIWPVATWWKRKSNMIVKMLIRLFSNIIIRNTINFSNAKILSSQLKWATGNWFPKMLLLYPKTGKWFQKFENWHIKKCELISKYSQQIF